MQALFTCKVKNRKKANNQKKRDMASEDIDSALHDYYWYCTNNGSRFLDMGEYTRRSVKDNAKPHGPSLARLSHFICRAVKLEKTLTFRPMCWRKGLVRMLVNPEYKKAC